MENNKNQLIPINNSLISIERQLEISEKFLGLLKSESDDFFYEDSPRGEKLRKEWYDSLSKRWKKRLGIKEAKTDTDLLQILIDLKTFISHSPKNKIKNITPLKKLTRLTKLVLKDNEINDITPLKELFNLTELILKNNQISDLFPLKELTNLKTLCISERNISDILPLKGLTNLTELELTGGYTMYYGMNHVQYHQNEIIDITPLINLINLTNLTIISNKLKDFTPLKKLTNLTKLDLRDNKINDRVHDKFP